MSIERRSDMGFVDILGYLAGILTTAAFVPQVMKTWKTRSAKDVSLGMFAIFCTGVLLWLVYGVLKKDPRVAIANAITLLLAGLILILKVRYG